ncbi:MAG: glycogen synthase 2 [Candidatus Binatia bacterium]|nr:MAG: glycogen synthase 2 [Candidatus Binatia bacterium]
MGALPRFLRARGVDVAVVLPGYRCLRRPEFRWEATDYEVEVPISGEWIRAPVWRTAMRGGVPVYAIVADRYFDRPELYGEAGQPYPDNAERFAFFSRAVLDLVDAVGVPDIIHVHDWHAALVPAFLRADARRYEWGAHSRTVLTIHNLAYQGSFWAQDWHILCLPDRFFSFDGFEAWGNINYLKAGISFADWLTTVSPTYSREIQTPESGFGLDGALRYRSDRLIGILNGVDYEEWNPATDPSLEARFDVQDLSGKQHCKAMLQSAHELRVDETVPLAGVVSRLVPEKGMDFLAEVVPMIVERGVQLVLLGKGEPNLEKRWKDLGQEFHGHVAVSVGFDEILARRIYGGADLFLMPSRFEPCGLAQMYAMRYGAVPVVHATGGLVDSVIDVRTDPTHGTGFRFHPLALGNFLSTLDDAVSVYGNRKEWSSLRERTMRADFSWHRTAAAYVDLYMKAVVAPPFRDFPRE